MVSEPDQSAAVIAFVQAQYRAHGIGRWAVLHRATGDFMGWARPQAGDRRTNGRRNFYDLGYRFRPEYWGQGYGYEAAQAWLDYGFNAMKLPEICGLADVANLASCRILEKVGLRRINEFEENGTRCAWFELPRQEWLSRFAAPQAKP